ncbi:MAG: 6-bladed beta-propeller [Balneola sp.]
MKQFIFIIFIFPILTCESEKKERVAPQKVVSINPNEAKSVKRSEIFSDYFFRKLNTPDSVKFASVDELTLKNNKIFIFDREQGLKVLVFKLNGDFLFEINSYGRGPGEYIQPVDFVVDSENDVLSILDTGNFKVISYDLSTGIFINEKKFDFFTEYFTKTNNGYLFFNNNFQNSTSPQNLYFTDRNLNILDKKMPIPENKMGFHFGLIRHFGGKNETKLALPFHNMIYSILENDYEPYLKVDFGSKNLPDNFFDQFTSTGERIRESRQYANNISVFFEFENNVFLTYKYDRKIYYYLADDENKKSIHTNYDILQQDIELGPIYPYPKEIYENYLVWDHQAYELKNYLRNKKEELGEAGFKEFQESNPKLMELDQSLDEDDNPYLIFTKIDF